MELFLEILVQFLLEVFWQILVEVLAEFGLRSVFNALNIDKPKNPYLSSLGYILLATIFAIVSLYLLPNHLIKRNEMRILYLITMPIIIGIVMSIRGKILSRESKNIIKIDTFFYGYLFAFTVATIRYFYAH